MPCNYKAFEGSIEGLYLPRLAWDVFHRGNIQTIDQLRTVADHLERFEGFCPITVRVIRQELDRVAGPGEHLFQDGGFLRGMHDSDKSRNRTQGEKLIRQATIARLERALNFADPYWQIC